MHPVFVPPVSRMGTFHAGSVRRTQFNSMGHMDVTDSINKTLGADQLSRIGGLAVLSWLGLMSEGVVELEVEDEDEDEMGDWSWLEIFRACLHLLGQVTENSRDNHYCFENRTTQLLGTHGLMARDKRKLIPARGYTLTQDTFISWEARGSHPLVGSATTMTKPSWVQVQSIMVWTAVQG